MALKKYVVEKTAVEANEHVVLNLSASLPDLVKTSIVGLVMFGGGLTYSLILAPTPYWLVGLCVLGFASLIYGTVLNGQASVYQALVFFRGSNLLLIKQGRAASSAKGRGETNEIRIGLNTITAVGYVPLQSAPSTPNHCVQIDFVDRESMLLSFQLNQKDAREVAEQLDGWVKASGAGGIDPAEEISQIKAKNRRS